MALQPADPAPVESASDLATSPALVPGEYYYSDPSGGEAVAVVIGDNEFLRAVPDLQSPAQVLAVYDGDVYFVYPDERLVSAHRGGASDPVAPDAGILDPVFLQRAASGELPEGVDASIVPAPAAGAASEAGLVAVPSQLTITAPDGAQREWALTQPRQDPSTTPREYIGTLIEKGYELEESVDPGTPDSEPLG